MTVLLKAPSDPKVMLSMTGLKELLANNERLDRIYHLKGRWADEREYEDFEEYVKAMKQVWSSTSLECLSLNKNFEAVLRDTMRDIKWKVKFTNKNVTFIRIK